MTNGHVYGVEIFMILLHKIIYFFYFFPGWLLAGTPGFRIWNLFLRRKKYLNYVLLTDIIMQIL